MALQELATKDKYVRALIIAQLDMESLVCKYADFFVL